MYMPQHMLFVSDFTCLLRNRNASFFASVDASTLAQYIFHVYLVVNTKRELKFIMAVTVGLQDISSMYINLGKFQKIYLSLHHSLTNLYRLMSYVF